MEVLLGKMRKITRPLLTPKEVAELLRMSMQQLRLDRSKYGKNRIPCIRINPRVIRYRVKDIAKLLKDNYVSGEKAKK